MLSEFNQIFVILKLTFWRLVFVFHIFPGWRIYLKYLFATYGVDRGFRLKEWIVSKIIFVIIKREKKSMTPSYLLYSGQVQIMPLPWTLQEDANSSWLYFCICLSRGNDKHVYFQLHLQITIVSVYIYMQDYVSRHMHSEKQSSHNFEC